MNNIQHNSSSKEQQDMEIIIADKVSKELGFVLERNSIVNCKDSTIKPDLFSFENKIIGEIYSHVGRLKPTQKNKILADVLKMILFEEIHKENFRKIIAVCDDDIFKDLTTNSWAALSIKTFNIEIIKVDIGIENIEIIKNVQRRQYR